MHPPIQFKMGFRGILLLHRSKDGAKGNTQRNSIKKISSCPEEYDEIVEELQDIQSFYPNHRIYSSVNERNMDQSIREFKRRQLDVDYEDGKKFGEFYCDIKNRFFSCLMNPKSRNESLWLLDCDTPEEFLLTKDMDSDLIIYEYQTKNGMHVITKPFNPNEYPQLIPLIKKDDLIYVG